MIEGARGALSRVRRVLLQAPTGAGKTALAAFMACESYKRGRVVWFVCHRAELVTQTSLTFTKYGLRHGFIAAGRPYEPTQRVFICSIDTLKSRLLTLAAPDVILWDECHHIGAAGWAAVMAHYPRARHVGLSATPQRLDGKGLDAFFDEMVLGPSVAWLIERGHLSPYKAFAPSSPDMAGVRKAMGDYSKGDAGKAMDKPKLTGDAIAHWLKLANGLRTVAFGCTVAHSQHLAAQFTAAGIPAAHLDGGTEKGERKAIIERYAAGELRMLTNVGLFGEGFDLAAIAQRDVTIDCVLDMNPTMSLSWHLQKVGRALRPQAGKVAIILDHAGNTLRHGYPDDEREWTLAGREGGGRKAANDEGPPPPVICEGCFMAIRRPLPPECPHCGKVILAKPREIEVAEGELEEQTEVHKRQIRAQLKREQAEARDLGALVALGQRRGFASPQQWAWKVWSSRQQKAA